MSRQMVRIAALGIAIAAAASAPVGLGAAAAAAGVPDGAASAAIARPGDAAQPAARLAGDGSAPRIGYAAPAFALPGMDGGSYSLDRFRGKPVVLNFWASWCGPCRDEAPYLTKLYREYGSDLQVVAINLTDVDSEQAAREFVAANGFDFPVLLDKKGKAADSYRIRPIPSTFFIDAKGVIQDGALGALSWEEFEARAKSLLHPGP